VITVRNNGVAVEIVSLTPANGETCVVVLTGDQVLQASAATNNGLLHEGMLLVLRRDGKFFVSGEFMKAVFGLDVTCYTTQAVMVRAGEK